MKRKKPSSSSSQPPPAERRSLWRTLAGPAIVAVAALLMGLPSLPGEFLPGDDITLVRDHVLINRPSLDHAVKLFRPDANRDLYQPVPLLTFAANFAIVHRLGLRAEQGVLLFHLTNVVLHAGTAVLVWWLIARRSRDTLSPVIAGVLFSIHPLNVETVAWLNGRMMLTSTLFAVATLVAADAWQSRRRWPAAVLCVLCTTLAMMSKVRPDLPVLLLLLMLLRSRRPAVRAWIVWGIVAATTVFFAWVNLGLSRGQLEAGAETLEGTRAVRTILALGWYLGRFVVPYGLASWHPMPNPARWTDPALIPTAIIVLLASTVVLVFHRRVRFVGVGVVWFLITIAVTLPLIPSRNVLVAERYFYLPGIGLCWSAAALLAAAAGAMRRRPAPAGKAAAVALGIIAALALLVTSWRYALTYRTGVARAQQMAACYPASEGVWRNLAQAYLQAGRFRESLEAARKEQRLHPEAESTSAAQLEGMALFRLGRIAEGLAVLEAAVAKSPEDSTGLYRLAGLYQEANRQQDALRTYVRAAEVDPRHNPALTAAGTLLLGEKRYGQARAMFEQALLNNPYDLTANHGLAEIDVDQGRLDAAADRLESMLSWLPDYDGARATLTLVELRRGRPEQALAQVERILANPRRNPLNVSESLLAALKEYSAEHTEDPYAIFLASLLLLDQGQPAVARQGLLAFKSLCPDPAWQARADRWLSR